LAGRIQFSRAISVPWSKALGGAAMPHHFHHLLGPRAKKYSDVAVLQDVSAHRAAGNRGAL
jgi:hypothetical protein